MENISTNQQKKKRGKWLAAIMVAVIALGMGTRAWIVKKNELKSPLYYRYLMERYLPTEADSVVETCIMELKYLTNRGDKREVTKVVFNNAEELKVEVDYSSSSTYGAYKLVTVQLYLEWNQDPAVTLPESVSVNTIQVEYSDQSKQTVEIGNIGLYSGKISEDHFEVTDCWPLDNQGRIQTYQAVEELEIVGVPEWIKESLKKEDIIETISFTADGKDLLNQDTPFKIPKGSQLDFRIKLKDAGERRMISLDSEFDSYQVEPKIIYRDSSGKEHFQSVHIWLVQKGFESGKEVRDYLKNRK